MPREDDGIRLQQLREIFASVASDIPEFKNTALYGGHRRDEGLDALLPGERSVYEKRVLLKKAILTFLDAGGRPNRREESGDADMQLDAAVFYEFRIEVEGVRLFVKTVFDEEEPNDPVLSVLSVKRAD